MTVHDDLDQAVAEWEDTQSEVDRRYLDLMGRSSTSRGCAGSRHPRHS
jgi:hypothetical protein